MKTVDVEEVKRKAASGRPKYQVELGIMHMNCEEGFEENFLEARHCFSLAADKGYAPGYYYLGGMFEDGLGVERDPQKAASLYYQSAKQGHALSQINLGHLYAMGSGVDEDVTRAIEWFYIAEGSTKSDTTREVAARERRLLEAQYPHSARNARQNANLWLGVSSDDSNETETED